MGNLKNSFGILSTKSSTLSEDQINDFIQSKINSMKPGEEEYPFYVLDLGVAKGLMDIWRSKFPSVKPFYAVKCNPEPKFLAGLAKMGVNFDCASKSEIELILSLGVSAERIVFANTCKPSAHIKHAASVGVNLTTYDSKYELDKIKKWHPKCRLLLRIQAGGTQYARRPLLAKAGARKDEVLQLLLAARTACLPVVGVSFHAGSACINPEAYRIAIAFAKEVFSIALDFGMPMMRILDIGGGFIPDTALFEDFASAINNSLQEHFGDQPSIEIISEPGRYFADTSFTLVANIIGKRVRSEIREYWVNDGIHGSMIIIPQEPTRVMPAVRPFASKSNFKNPCHVGENTYASIIHGPTGDARDTILTNYQLPDLEINDWLVFTNMGAYTATAGTKFNGFDTSAIITYACNQNF